MIDPRATKLRDSYEHFVFHSWNMGKSEDNLAWIPTKFHRYLCNRIQKFLEDRTKGVRIMIISTPPQHGTNTISHRWQDLNLGYPSEETREVTRHRIAVHDVKDEPRSFFEGMTDYAIKELKAKGLAWLEF